jgi:hypothetical protein
MPKPARATRRKRSTPSKAPVRVVARLAPAQVAALEREARRRVRERGGRRADVSELVGEAISVWMSIRPAQRAIIRAVAERQELTRPEVLRQALDAWLTSLDPRDG